MFTGIITDIGTVRSAEQRGDLRLTIALRLRHGDGRPRRVDRLLGRLPDRGRQGRRLVRGRCLGRNRVADRARTCGAKARRLNLERSLRVGDELGGHIVTGHVDAVGDVVEATPEGDSTRIVRRGAARSSAR